MERKIVASVMAVMMLVSMFFLARTAAIHTIARRSETEWATMPKEQTDDGDETETVEETETAPVEWNGEVVVIDAGHGGSDPGKIGVNDAEEKGINLSIAKKLKQKFEDIGYQVVMTREDDRVLEEGETYGEESGKAADMRKRIDIINGSGSKVMVSIHQNSFEMPEVRGPQVFYYETSPEGQRLAELVQNLLNTELEIASPRAITPNSNYYLLHNSEPVAIIVECGFLSNPEEAALLSDPDYQDKVADIISRAVDEFYKG